MALHQPPTRPHRPRGTRPGARTTGRAAAGKPMSVTARHAEWIRLVRPDGPFIALPVLTDVFAQGLDTQVPAGERVSVIPAVAGGAPGAAVNAGRMA